MSNKIISKNYILLACASLWLGLEMHLYPPNNGGVGLALPQNTLGWGAIALLSLIIWLGVWFNKSRIIITPAASRSLSRTKQFGLGIFCSGYICIAL